MVEASEELDQLPGVYSQYPGSVVSTSHKLKQFYQQIAQSKLEGSGLGSRQWVLGWCV